MSKFENAQKVYASGTAEIPQLEKAIADLGDASRLASADLAASDAALRELLLVGSDKKLAEARVSRESLHLGIERTAALQAALTARRDEARAAAEAKAIGEKRAEIESAIEVAKSCLEREYPKFARLILDMLKGVSEADAKALAFNRAHPNAVPIETAESRMRFVRGAPEKEIGARTVSLWCFAGSAQPLGQKDQGLVVTHGHRPRHGSLPGIGLGGAKNVEARIFVETKVQPATAPKWVAPLAENLALPALHPGEPDYFAPLRSPTPVSVLETLNHLAARHSRTAPAPDVVTRLHIAESEVQSIAAE